MSSHQLVFLSVDRGLGDFLELYPRGLESRSIPETSFYWRSYFVTVFKTKSNNVGIMKGEWKTVNYEAKQLSEYNKPIYRDKKFFYGYFACHLRK